MLRFFLHGLAILLLTLLTQLGGIAWLIALATRRRVLTFLFVYVALWGSALVVAPLFGRVPLPCWPTGELQFATPLYCALNRHYVRPEMRDVLLDLGREMERRYPGTITLVLDANFPFIDGFPLLPHLSHQDGRSADLAFFYRRGGAYLPGSTRSPIGYFAFEDGPSDCPEEGTMLRWNLRWLQPLWPDMEIEPERTRLALNLLARDARVRKILLEPHLKRQLGLASSKIRFQGCHAARHDDHLHIQL
ncbi:MAG: hypothetical protein AAGC81_08335 [Pseudomonadota bacterium]